MSRPVVVAAPALQRIEAIDAWWHANRSASPDLFAEELAEAFFTIGLAPEARAPVPPLCAERRAPRSNAGDAHHVTTS